MTSWDVLNNSHPLPSLNSLLPFPFIVKQQPITEESKSFQKTEYVVPHSTESIQQVLKCSDMRVELRSESGLMTGRRTLFFLEAEWPTEILQQKEFQDIRIFYYPGNRNVDWNPNDPAKLWLTERFFPGTTVYLELQFWALNPTGNMEFVSRCHKHGNIVKISTHRNAKDNSDQLVNWKGSSAPKVAMCFCCTPSCFKKTDPFMFARLRFGNYCYQSSWFQLEFRKSNKRRSSGSFDEEDFHPSSRIPKASKPASPLSPTILYCPPPLPPTYQASHILPSFMSIASILSPEPVPPRTQTTQGNECKKSSEVIGDEKDVARSLLSLKGKCN